LRRLKARRAAKAFEAEILKQSEQQAAYARPDRRAEILELRQQMEQGIGSLKSSRLGGGKGTQALYALPWYMIIGPPGSGKTTALKKSGLNFAFNPEEGGLRGVGGTRNCDWWFTNDAILLDTAGRYATETDDRDEWLAFLGLLKRFRSQKPINGVLVAVSVTDLMDARDDQIADMARQLRTRIDELMSRLEMVVPVYLMFTKADLIGGFVESFGDMRKSERDQILGATFALKGDERDASTEFVREFDQMVHVLHANALRRIKQHRSFQGRQKVLEFPVEFQSLRDNLSSLVGQLFQPNRFQGTPIFRGFYFTSGTQEGNPVSRMIGRMAQAFGLPPDPGAQMSQVETKSYFVTDLFQRVVFPDQNVAAHTEAQRRRRTLMRIVFAASCLFVSLAIIIPSTITFGRNQSLVSRVEAVSRSASSINWNDSSPLPEKLAKLDNLRSLYLQLKGWDDDGPPTGMRWGMYTGGNLLEPVRSIYIEQMHKGFTVSTRPELEAQLRAFKVADAEGDTFSKQYDQLKLYLMLGDTERLDVEFAAKQVARYWAKALRSSKPEEDAKLLLPHAKLYLRMMKEGEARPWDHDKQLIDHSRQTMLKAPRVDRLYTMLVRDANSDVAPIRMSDFFYGESAKWVTPRKNVQVQGAYTKEGYLQIKKVLNSQKVQLETETWVLAESVKDSETQTEEVMEKLRDRYFTTYEKQWRELFLDIEVKKPATDAEAIKMYGALSEPEWPYLRLIRSLAENARIHVSESELSKAGRQLWQRKKSQYETRVRNLLRLHGSASSGSEKEVQPLSPMESAFLPLLEFGAPPRDSDGTGTPKQLTDYINFMTALQGKLTDQRDSPMARPKDMAPDYEIALRGALKLLEEQDPYTRPMLEPLLLNPFLRDGVKRPRRF
ncbi:MAG: type VI secretion system membrane subunit TssM, partial [Myxococcales bacterium]|nr:type VI secretion system membrane subunit TssM [Myxococcales bacterium]